jgi:CheY-like chemotaxis protein
VLQERDCALNVESRPGKFVEVTVTDTGSGMTPEVLGHIFEPFFTTKEPGRAAGMGLALVYGIVKAHGGWVTVQSEPNHGSTFRLYLPVGEGGPAAGEARPDRPESRSGGLVLVVDDEDMVRGLADVVLRRGGYEVLQAGGGEEALAIFSERAREIDLILLDYSMPGMTGLQVMREMQKIDPGVCVVFSSGYTRDSDTDQLLATGARAFVPKPYRPDDLVQTVRRVLQEQRGERPPPSRAT